MEGWNVQKPGLNFKKAMEINNDLVKLYTAVSEIELQTSQVNEMKEKFVGVIKEELKKLQDSRIVVR